MKVELISWTQDPVNTIAQAYSICYLSNPSTKIIKSCIKSGHMSPLEMASFVFKIEGLSRAAAQQLTRHRIASYAMQSMRYTKLNTGDFSEFVMPPNTTEANEYYYTCAYDAALESYEQLLTHDIPAEDARGVIPLSVKCQLIVSMNLRSLAHFMNERLCTRAQAEIRELARLMKYEILTKVPQNEEEKEIFSMLLVPKCEMHSELSFCPEVKGCGRHMSLKEIKNIINDYKL